MRGSDTGTPRAGTPGAGIPRHDDGRRENTFERADRNMSELLQELRVVQAGVQILFAFLLTMSFTDRFGRIDGFQLTTYVVTLLLSVVTAGLLIAPAAAHRITFRRGLKPQTVQLGHRMFTAGLLTLTLTLTGAVLLVLDVAVGRWFGIVAASAVAVVLLGLWLLLPAGLLRHAPARSEAGEVAGSENGSHNAGEHNAGGRNAERPPPGSRETALT